MLIEVEDECGGLPFAAEGLVRPLEHRSGLDLAIARQSVESNGGEIRVRSVTGRGCVYTIDLPRRSPRTPEVTSAIATARG